jgi:flagellar motility protein MotE (MotC chaperone)
MLRYDPTKPDHAKFEKQPENEIKKKVLDVSLDRVMKVSRGKCEEKEQNVIVSKEQFYKVAESLKETLQKRNERNEFSLRKMFGTSDGGMSYFLYSYM